MAEKEPGVKFVGRLASYKYFNMDQVNIFKYKTTLTKYLNQAILNALEFFDSDIRSLRWS